MDICKKKVLNLIFKNCIKISPSSVDLVEYLFFNLKMLFKFKLYENLKKGILNIKLVERFFGKLPIEIINSFINFLFRLECISETSFKKEALLIAEMLKYHISSHQNNIFFRLS